MLRLLGYFALVFATMFLLRYIPWIGGIFRIPFLGFMMAAAIVSIGLAKVGTIALDSRRAKNLERSLGAVETPHNQGKLGSLLLSQGRVSKALPLLERAVAGEPDAGEWAYRLGIAYLAKNRFVEAVRVLERAAEIDEERAYGAVMLRLAEARVGAGDAAGALDAIARFERNHGPNPESAYRRGLALRVQGKSAESKAAFGEVGRLASQAARFQKSAQRGYVVRAWLQGLR